MIDADSSSTLKTIATINAAGVVDTSTTTIFPYGGTATGSTALRTSATVDGTSFYCEWRKRGQPSQQHRCSRGLDELCMRMRTNT